MLFQGQEFGSSRPFSYFADQDDELAQSVEEGRLEFLAQFPPMATPEMRRLVPTPALSDTFEHCKLDDAERVAHGPLLRLHRDLLRLRREDEVVSESGSGRVRIESSTPADGVVLIRLMAEAAERLLIVNLGADHLSPMNDPLLAPPSTGRWIELWSSEHPCYGGGGVNRVVRRGRWLLPGHAATLLGTGERASTG
jgi:maltooligosyltrehalose trehalohydrolase